MQQLCRSTGLDAVTDIRALLQAQPRTPMSPVSSPGAASSSSTSADPVMMSQKNRRLAGFGRKIRSALCDFLTIKPQ